MSNTSTATREVTSVDRLAAHLRAGVHGEVRFDDGSRALYSTDASNYRQVPIGVVIPHDAAAVVSTIEICRRHGVPVVSRGGGTSLAGQTCNVAVVLDMSKYFNRILEINPDEHFARVEPGVVLDTLRDAAEQYNLTFGPDPSTHDHCTLGGMIGNNSCGVHSVMAGKTDDNVEALEILTYDGTRMWVGPTSDEDFEHIIGEGGRRGDIYRKVRDFRDRYADEIRKRFPQIPRRVSGYNLDQLLPENGCNIARALVGSESTLVTVLQAKVRLVDSPPVRSLLVIGYPDLNQCGADVPFVLESKPIGLEGIDDKLVEDMVLQDLYPDDVALLPAGRAWLMAEFGGETKEEADQNAHGLMKRLKARDSTPSMRLFDDPHEEEMLWRVREAGLGATAHVPGQDVSWPGWEDSAVDPKHLGEYLKDLRELFDQYGYDAALYGHFGQGCVHCRISFELRTAPGIAHFDHFLHDAAKLVVRYGGSISGEHGDGQGRAELLPIMYGDDMVHAFEEFKSIWDPDWKMNPGKVVRPNKATEDLRLGASYAPRKVNTHFAYLDDGGDFGRVAIRCVGVGECRKHDSDTGVMCPSYMVTREEEHSTRGRARLLFEMMQGETIEDGWRSDAVRESLDLCLACKGCKQDCPVHVDMATYKAEFLSHYYERRLRPRAAYAMGLIYWWARIASRMPGLSNAIASAPVVSPVFKWLGGIAPQRQVPKFASPTFVEWFRQRPVRNADGPKVIFWPDTFSNFFFPEAARAAVEVLESGGYHVTIPGRPLCCGRPLYDWGMLDLAARQWRQILGSLRDEIRAGVPIVGLEPSCVAAFRDELGGLFPADEDARRLAMQTSILSEFLVEHRDRFDIPKLDRKAVIQLHCHQHAVIGVDAEAELLHSMGLDYEFLDSGCCGMAGSFGFQRGQQYEVSVAEGERALFPAIREQDASTIVIANGFSCREQIEQGTARKALHIAQVIRMAMDGGGGLAERYPERGAYDARPRSNSKAAALAATGAGAGMAGLAALATLARRLRR